MERASPGGQQQGEAGACFVSAYVSLILADENVPAWVYGFVALLVAFGAWSTVRSIRTTIAEATAETA